MLIRGQKYITKEGRELRIIQVWGEMIELIDEDWNTYYYKAEDIRRGII